MIKILKNKLREEHFHHIKVTEPQLDLAHAMLSQEGKVRPKRNGRKKKKEKQQGEKTTAKHSNPPVSTPLSVH